MSCSLNVFFINNPKPDPELSLKPDPDTKNKINNNFGSTTLDVTCDAVFCMIAGGGCPIPSL
jgi:hypothetical protein